MGLTGWNIALNLLYYTATIVIIPWCLLTLEHRVWPRGDLPPVLRGFAAFLGITGAVLQVWCLAVLQRAGGGTASPLIPTVKLVTGGPYRWVRNPLNVGEVILFVGLAGWFASWLLLAYATAAWVAFHLFVVYFEEPRHLERFGEEYAQYKATVGRWLPRAQALLKSRAD